jgi:tetratricopeptide (TPR) repeat protein
LGLLIYDSPFSPLLVFKFFCVARVGAKLYCLPQEWFYIAVPNESLAERLNGKLHRLFVVLIIACVVLSSFAPMMNQVDLGWQVAQGRWITQHAALYSRDVFNYPNLGHPVINEYPLFEVVLYLAWSLGWWGPCLLAALAFAALVGVLLRSTRLLDLQDSSLAAIAIGLMLLFFQIAFPLRPHLATYLGVTVLGAFLLRHREAENWTRIWPMALLQIAWTNCHSGFVLGPAMVALFGAEITVRRWLREKSFPWIAARTWLGAFLLIFLACFVNPYGWERFYPPFFQDRLESIRAYVREMEPLVGGQATIYSYLTLIAIIVVVLAVIRRGWAISYSFLLLAFLFYVQAQSVNKAWPVFGLFVPLLVLSSGAFASTARKSGSWPGVFGIFVTTVIVAMAVVGRLNASWDSSLQRQWQEYDHSRSELSLDATAWMKAHGVEGRLFHRCEDGGWLQQEGYDQGQTFSDTGFGKYDEAFIHEVGMVNERPALVPRFLSAYRPDDVVCSNFCYQWPFYLKQNGWRLIFYSPNSSVWTRPELRPDLPTVRDEEVMTAFDHDLAANGIPADVSLFGRNIIALNSLGLEDFAFVKLTGLPEELHHASWYWEAARMLCFAEPEFTPAHRDTLMHEAESLHDDTLTAEFRAYHHYYAGDSDGALSILENIPPNQLGNYAAELLLKIELDRKRPEALALARRTDYFDLRNGRHWEYLAQAEDQAGNTDAARVAWEKAVFYYPDDAALMEAATAFAAKFHDSALTQAIADSGKIYGRP